MWKVIIAVCLFVMTGANLAIAEQITIAAAANLNFAFREIATEYEKTNSNQVRLTFGSSGNFYAQIQNGAPFDLFFSADIEYPKKLEEAGLTVPGSLYQYAVGRIVLWTGHESRIDVTKGMEALREPTLKKVAIANPKHAPYGRAAVAAMEHFKVYDQVKDKLVLGENISQAAQFIESGACDIGIIALSLAVTPAMKSKGTYWEIPVGAHLPLEQAVVILKSSKQRESAEQFLAFVKGERGREIMQRHGFTQPN
jgi:molybdate transport system substrate-binding protein